MTAFGEAVVGWVPPARPTGEVLQGQTVRLEHMDADHHAADLHRAYTGHDALWDYLPYGPFSSAAAYHRFCKETASGSDPLFYVLRDQATGLCGGVDRRARATAIATGLRGEVHDRRTFAHVRNNRVGGQVG